ncbi:hypothetical protein ABPG72_005227 [Tetrahymena utriculariae]
MIVGHKNALSRVPSQNMEPYISRLLKNRQIKKSMNKFQKIFFTECEEFLDENTFFQHDNARPHTGQKVQELFDENNINILPWASQSPDINPIEGIWSFLKWKVEREVSNFRNFEGFIEYVKTTFLYDKDIEKQIQNSINNIPKRLHQLIDRNGNLIN